MFKKGKTINDEFQFQNQDGLHSASPVKIVGMSQKKSQKKKKNIHTHFNFCAIPCFCTKFTLGWAGLYIHWSETLEDNLGIVFVL